jgi:hypothetical protein
MITREAFLVERKGGAWGLDGHNWVRREGKGVFFLPLPSKLVITHASYMPLAAFIQELYDYYSPNLASHFITNHYTSSDFSLPLHLFSISEPSSAVYRMIVQLGQLP